MFGTFEAPHVSIGWSGGPGGGSFGGPGSGASYGGPGGGIPAGGFPGIFPGGGVSNSGWAGLNEQAKNVCLSLSSGSASHSRFTLFRTEWQ